MTQNYIEAVSGQELKAGDIQRSGHSVIVVTPPGEDPALSHAVIHLPRAATSKGELTIVSRWDAFGYLLLPAGNETIDGRRDFAKPAGNGVRLVPLVGDGKDGWGTI